MRRHGYFQPDIAAGLGAALLFGAGTPLAKGLLSVVDPWLLGAIISGGVVGPVLLMFGLSRMPASDASLLLNAESVFTALLAWFVFKENFDRRVVLGMLAIVAGAVVLSWPSDGGEGVTPENIWPPLAVLGACLAWAIDNNLTRQVSLSDATWIASLKGLAAGSVNLTLALALGAAWPGPQQVAGALVVGLFAYGISLTLFVVALRHLGTARTGAYFSTAPFIGVACAIALLGEAPPASFWLAAILMGSGVWLHLTERHEHEHLHAPLEHMHQHAHDEHHQHEHDLDGDGAEPHSHAHRHEAKTHSHPHYPDVHHRHRH